jgi:hypothetical protein
VGIVHGIIVQVVVEDTMEEGEEDTITLILFLPEVVDHLILLIVLLAIVLSVKESHRLIT